MDREFLYAHPSQLAACQALVYSLLQRCEVKRRNRGFALALVSSHPAAGVSHIQALLEQMLNENEAHCAIALDCEVLGMSKSVSGDRAESATPESSDRNDRSRDDRHVLACDSGIARYRDRVGHLNALLESFRYVLLDCHSLKEKTDVLGLAPMLDGIIIVVECNRTSTNQLEELERSIERYGGTIWGSVLNKTTYAIPTWLNSLMERAGI